MCITYLCSQRVRDIGSHTHEHTNDEKRCEHHLFIIFFSLHSLTESWDSTFSIYKNIHGIYWTERRLGYVSYSKNHYLLYESLPSLPSSSSSSSSQSLYGSVFSSQSIVLLYAHEMLCVARLFAQFLHSHRSSTHTIYIYVDCSHYIWEEFQRSLCTVCTL